MSVQEPVRSSAVVETSVPFFGCAREYELLLRRVEERVREVLLSGQVLQGPEVIKFELEVARITGREHAIAVGSGTDALFFALRSLGIGVGDEVLVPDLTFIASISAVLRCGAKPVFVDVNNSCNLDLRRAVEK